MKLISVHKATYRSEWEVNPRLKEGLEVMYDLIKQNTYTKNLYGTYPTVTNCLVSLKIFPEAVPLLIT